MPDTERLQHPEMVSICIRTAFSSPLSEDELDELRPSTDSRPSYMLSLRISSDKLKSLGLLYGANECRFSITTKFQVRFLHLR